MFQTFYSIKIEPFSISEFLFINLEIRNGREMTHSRNLNCDVYDYLKAVSIDTLWQTEPNKYWNDINKVNFNVLTRTLHTGSQP